MWRKIKSSFILQNIFNYIDKKSELNLAIYNKQLQKKLGLTLIDFKKFSGRYRIEEYGKIWEYNSYNNKLLFSGHYSNGKRNGEGKEYNDEGKLIFEGEYLDGKKWKGVEKEYDEDNNILILECEYLNGKREGKQKNMINIMVNYYFLENILMEKGMEKE